MCFSNRNRRFAAFKLFNQPSREKCVEPDYMKSTVMLRCLARAVNLSIKILEPCSQTQNPDLDGSRRGETRFSRRVSLKPHMSSEGLVKENQKNRHRRVSLNILAIFALTGPYEVHFSFNQPSAELRRPSND